MPTLTSVLIRRAVERRRPGRTDSPLRKAPLGVRRVHGAGDESSDRLLEGHSVTSRAATSFSISLTRTLRARHPTASINP